MHEYGKKGPVGTTRPAGHAPALSYKTREPRLTLEQRPPDGARLVLSGDWVTSTLQSINAEFVDAFTKTKIDTVDLSAVTRFDTAAALALNEASKAMEEKGHPLVITGLDRQCEKLLETARLAPISQNAGKRKSALTDFLEGTGRAVIQVLATVKEIVGFFGFVLISALRLILHPREIRGTSLTYHIEQTGLKAIPIISLLTFLIGVVVAYMGSDVLSQFGAQVFAVKLLEVTVLREMAVLITAIVVAGRSSSSFTAQIGAMVANEEVAALKSMGLDPMVLLVIPRIMALVVTLPMLVFLANLAALTGGALALWFSMDLSFASFWSRFHDAVNIGNFFVGMVKTPFFGLGIGIIGCYQGFKATGSAESVGFLTTISVVQSIFVVILLDALFALFFTTIGI